MMEQTPPASSHWQDALAAARSGRQGAAARLLEVYRPYLLALANDQVPPVLRAKEAASDIVQETILKAHGEIGGFRGHEREEFVGWLRQILFNGIVDCSRRWRADKRDVERELSLDQGDSGHNWNTELLDDAPPPDLALLKLDEMSEVNRALETMPSHFVQVILLRSRDKKPFEEIGAILGRTAEAARKLWVRGLAELQQRLKRES
jgi:RNA polymerase sigma-70 factor (ECF subfamily)